MSTVGCPSSTPVDGIYSDSFLRSLYASIAHNTSYNLSFFGTSSLELIMPIVDCASGARVLNDSTCGKFFYLVRSVTKPEVLSVIVITMANQGYRAVSRDDRGSAAVLSIAVISDMRDTNVSHHFALSINYPYQQFDFTVFEATEVTPDNYWKLRSLPQDPTRRSTMTLLTSVRTGIFTKAETVQASINQVMWVLAANATQVVESINWRGVQVLRDSWAWVHCVHIVFAADGLFQAVVLALLIVRHFSARAYWIGDAFVGYSSTLVLRGFIVLVTMVLNKFWALTEFCYSDAAKVTSLAQYVVFDDIVRADLLTIYLSVVGLLGKIMKERIDPALAVICFQFGFSFRRDILSWFPTLVSIIKTNAVEDFLAGADISDEDTSHISPMKVWGVRETIPMRPSFLCASMAPIFCTLVPLFLIEIVRKCVRHYLQNKTKREGYPVVTTRPRRRHSLVLRTNFELATGARLADKFGLVSDYDNYVFIKSLRFASA